MPATTADHVVPRCLFTPPLPLDMITVSACSHCNSEKAKVDTFLRDYLVCNVDASPNPVADSIRSGAYKRSVDRKQSELWKVIKAEQTEKLRLSKGGIDLGTIISMPFGQGPLKDSIVFIAKGVYNQLCGKRLPDDHSYLVGGIPNRETLAWQYEHLKSLGHVGSSKIGDNKVFSCFVGTYFSEEEKEFQASIWGFLFYDRTYIGCCSVAPGLKRKMNPAYLAQF